jgi:peptidoglycan-associated lipoprotein
MVMVLAMGCSSRQNINVKSEGLPPDQKKVEAMAEPEEIESLVVEKETLSPSSPERMPAPAPRELVEGSPPRDQEVSPTAESSDITTVIPAPLIEPPADLSKLPRTLTDIFFDYDQYRIRQDALTVLETNAKVLIGRYPDKKVVIQGHCDERGTREYNLILGERRAQAVKTYLIDLGVPEENMQVLSYGKEKPFCLEHSKKCWQQNRRSHFVIN